MTLIKAQAIPIMMGDRRIRTSQVSHDPKSKPPNGF